MGVEWWLSDAVKDESAAECQRLNIRTSELRAEVTRQMTSMPRTPENIDFLLDMIRKAQTIDQEVVNWMRDLPEQYHFKTVYWQDNVPDGDYTNAEVYPGRVDIYQDFWVASVINMARVTRLILASLIVRCAAWCCSPVDYRTTPEYATASRTCVDTITDIIASVPYHLGWHFKRRDILHKANLGQFACGEEESQKGLAGYFLSWPLACVNGQDYTTDTQRKWIAGRLKYIGDELGVKYAHMLAAVRITPRLTLLLRFYDRQMANRFPNSSR
jgi:hypothetical protein